MPSAGGAPRVDAASAPSSPPPPHLAEDESGESIQGWNWTGSDEFTPLGDRKDAPPLPLPRLKHSKRVVLVRHGQSTWNAHNRIQGSSNFSVLTDMGRAQAQAAHTLVRAGVGAVYGPGQGPPPAWQTARQEFTPACTGRPWLINRNILLPLCLPLPRSWQAGSLSACL